MSGKMSDDERKKNYENRLKESFEKIQEKILKEAEKRNTTVDEDIMNRIKNIITTGDEKVFEKTIEALLIKCSFEEHEILSSKELFSRISEIMKNNGMKNYELLTRKLIWSEIFYEEFTKNFIRISERSGLEEVVSYRLSEYSNVNKVDDYKNYTCGVKLLEDECIAKNMIRRKEKIKTKFFLFEISSNILGKYTKKNNKYNWYQTEEITEKVIEAIEKRTYPDINSLTAYIYSLSSKYISNEKHKKEFSNNILKIAVMQLEDIEKITVSRNSKKEITDIKYTKSN